jgi:hypothetical protein
MTVRINWGYSVVQMDDMDFPTVEYSTEMRLEFPSTEPSLHTVQVSSYSRNLMALIERKSSSSENCWTITRQNGNDSLHACLQLI